jgi:hydrogenase nickel incorporation protein HypA/HybF
MTGVLETVNASAHEAGAERVLSISLSIGVMTEAIEDALRFAFEALSEGSLSEGAALEITMVQPKSRCLECGATYGHDRFSLLCPECGSFATELVAGRGMWIDSIEVDIPDDAPPAGPSSAGPPPAGGQLAGPPPDGGKENETRKKPGA